MATARCFDINIDKGSDFELIIELQEDDGTIIDLTGYTAQMQIRPDTDSTVIIIELSTANGRIVIDGPAGKLTLTIANADTEAITQDVGVYDLEITSGGALIERILQGNVAFSPEVTR